MMSRADPVTSVKALVDGDYTANPTNVKALFIFGHVPIAKSGWLIPDGHFQRPFPTDLYYGISGGTWTDTADYGPANQPGDGIFDQNCLTDVLPGDPAPVKMETGRVDLWNLPTFDASGNPNLNSEVNRLRNYLDKEHNYRTNAFRIQQKGFIDDYFGIFDGEAFAQTAGGTSRPSSTPTVPARRVTWGRTPGRTPLSPRPTCGDMAGGGTYTSADGVATTADLLTCDPAVFTMLFGSYFCEWDYTDDFMRAELATANYGLTCAWAGRPNWFFQHMGIGEEIGYSTRLTQNNIDAFYQNAGACVDELQTCLMVDPTLRLTMITPPQILTKQIGTSSVLLNWSPSPIRTSWATTSTCSPLQRAKRTAQPESYPGHQFSR